MLSVVARAARTGKQQYADGEELRPAEEVFSEASMATWLGAPVIIEHRSIPDVSAAKEHAVGYVKSVSRDRGDGDGTEYVSAEIVIFDSFAEKMIRDGKLGGLSAGYSVRVDNGIQRDIRINHLALGPKGDWARCGSACSIGL